MHHGWHECVSFCSLTLCLILLLPQQCCFALQTGPTENPWLSAISSHFGYWTSLDTALFVLRGLHGLDVRQGVPKAEAAGALSPVASPPTTPATSG